MSKSILYCLVVTCGLIASCNNKPPEAPKAPPPPPVNTYTVTRGSAVYYDNYPATVAALNQVELRAQVTGYITGIFFKDGQHVSKGQKLYDIDRQQYEASYQQAEANLNVSKANLDRAQKDADRYNDLLRQDAIARQVVDHAMADLQSAKMQVAAAKAAVARAATDVQYSGIYAPFDGTIGISLVRMGALVTANATLLNTISSDNPMAVDIAVDQAEIPRFTKLQEHPIASDSTFTLQLADNSIYTKTGSISFIDRAVDAQTGTIKARLVFDNVGNALKVGMNANVRVKNNNPSSMLMLIPAKGLTEQMGEYFVFVVNDSSKVNLHRITVGQQINDKVVVKDGLKEGDKVVVDGMQKLKEGSLVQVKQ